MQVARAVDELPHALAPSGGAEPELDLKEGGVERLDSGHAEATGAVPGHPSGSWMVKTAEAALRR